MGRIRSHYRRRSGRRALVSSALGAFGVIWLVFEPVGLFFPDRFDWGWPGYLGLALIAMSIGIWRARPRDIEWTLPPSDVVIGVRVGDVLEQTGNVVVGSNDTFDTQFEDGVISSQSVQGQLLQRVFGGDVNELDTKLASSLQRATGEPDDAKEFGKKGRYPIGTVAVVHRGACRYFLSAIARMSTERPAHVTSSVEDLQVALTRTWEAVGQAGQREDVHAPIVGSKLARLGLSRTLLIQMMILSFIAATKEHSGSSSLTVWVSEADAATVDLVVIDDWLRGLCAA